MGLIHVAQRNGGYAIVIQFPLARTRTCRTHIRRCLVKYKHYSYMSCMKEKKQAIYACLLPWDLGATMVLAATFLSARKAILHSLIHVLL